MILEGVFEKQFSNGDVMYESKTPIFNIFSGRQWRFRATGASLPTIQNVAFRFEGSWSGDIFVVDEIAKAKDKTSQNLMDSLTNYYGFDSEIAGRMIFEFGMNVLSLLERDLEGLLEKITLNPWQKNLLRKTWYRYRYKDLFDYFSEFEVTEKQIITIIDRYEKTAMDVIRRNPYILPDVCGVSFKVADTIAMDNAVPWFSEMRISAAIAASLKMFESGDSPGEKTFMTFCRENKLPAITGNTCMDKDSVSLLTKSLLGEDHTIREEDFESSLVYSQNENAVIVKDGLLSRRQTATQEEQTAKSIKRLMADNKFKIDVTPEELLERSEEIVKCGGLSGPLSEEQRRAVCLALNNPVSIITGGPGTGKTTIQSAILYLLEDNIKNPRIKMLAPTGRAASRMEESTGYPASTIHSALGLDVDGIGKSKTLTDDVIIVDEFSMVDSFLADKLFEAIQPGTKVLCIGDVNQLPSVGAGSVLREMIESEVVPTALLTNVFRQAKGSSIADNAYKINDGKNDFTFDDTFSFEDVRESRLSDEVVKKFCEEIEMLDVDDVCVLTPFRRTTDTGTDALNKKIQAAVHEDYNGPKLTHFNDTYMIGDKIMYRKNKNGLTNGDVGYIKDIGDDQLTAQFGKNKSVVLKGDELNDITLAYAVTIHKSQGSEYKSVILVMDPKHRRMQKKALVYTAVTRAKGKLIAMGSRKALEESVYKEEASLRKSQLASYLRTEFAN